MHATNKALEIYYTTIVLGTTTTKPVTQVDDVVVFVIDEERFLLPW